MMTITWYSNKSIRFCKQLVEWTLTMHCSRRRSRAHFAIRRQWFGHWVDYLQYITVNYFQESHSGNAQPFFSQFELTFSSFLTLIGMREYTFHPLSFFGSDFDCWVKNFQPFLEVKIDINGVNLAPCLAHWVL